MKQAKNINTSIVKDFKNRVNTICTQRSTWQQTQFKSANDALYAMLGELYDITRQFTNNTKADELKYDWLLSECTKKGINLSKKPTFAQLLVKYVFTDNDTDSRRISSYARVLTAAAQSSEVAVAADVPVFIQKHGGIEEIRASLAKNTKTPKQRADAGRSIALNSKSIAEVTVDGSKNNATALKGSFVLLVGVVTAKGTVDVKHVCYELAPTDKLYSAKTAVNAALSNVYTNNDKQTKAAAKQLSQETAIADKNARALSVGEAADTDTIKAAA